MEPLASELGFAARSFHVCWGWIPATGVGTAKNIASGNTSCSRNVLARRMRSERREIRIVGGGLAGLSLGIALAKREVGVELYEAGTYPRHRVCGEFIAGLGADTAATLGIEEALSDAASHRSVTWFREDKAFRSDQLPAAALGISRFRLDQRLASLFEAHGGALRSRSRFTSPSSDKPEGVVWANGRKRGQTDWMGIKLHCRDLDLQSDLEVHLGDDAYAGASAVEEGRVNVCALIRRRPHMLKGPREDAFFDCLEAAGLSGLADRVRRSDPDLKSLTSVAGLAFGAVKRSERGSLCIGDAHALIPPFTGDGMAMAFEGAAAALHPLLEYSTGSLSWDEAMKEANRELQKRFKRRLMVAQGIHSFLYKPKRQAIFRVGTSARLLPFPPLFHLLH